MCPSLDHGSRDRAAADAVGRENLLQGLLELVTYHDPESLYSVLRISPETGYSAPPGGDLFTQTRCTAVGRVVEPVEGMRVRLTGSWGHHASHGTQFEFESFEPLPPVDELGLIRYLSSKTFDGIGETLARRIVTHLGQGTLDLIRDTPEALKGIPGLRADVARKLAASVRAQLAVHQTHAFLRGLGLGPLQAQNVVRKLGPDCEALLRKNPYRLAEVTGLGFGSADKIALQMGFEETDERRLAAGLLHCVKSAADDGHTLLVAHELVQRGAQLLGQSEQLEAFGTCLQELERDELLTVDASFAPDSPGDALVYQPYLYASEAGFAKNLAHLLEAREARELPALASEQQLLAAEAEAAIELHASQREAVLQLLGAPVGLLTGGPGVGKTTIVRLIAHLAEKAGAKVLLASPTGRAAKRLAEATGREAKTIHRLLGFNPAAGGFEHDADKPLKAGLIIIDEISMLDVLLAYHLSKAIKPPTRVVLVGDPNQLPSVGAGNVLSDLIASQCVPVARLTQIYRQDASSLIVSNAHHVLSGEELALPERGDLDADFFFFGAEHPAECADRLVDVVTKRIPQTFGFDWTNDVQVIAPMYKGECGVDVLNQRLRAAQGSAGREITRGSDIWRTGDRVIQTRNDYDKEVFNGDMGRIIEIDGDGACKVRFPEQDVIYSGREVSNLKPAFAITVHRSQGGEFPVVVIPLVTQHYMMLQRNLLYTAITRARKLVVLVGSKRALEMAIANTDQRERQSALAERLIGRLAEDSPHDE